MPQTRRKHKKLHQMTLFGSVMQSKKEARNEQDGQTTPDNLGHPIIKREKWMTRVYFQNVHGISPADRMEEHGINCQGWKRRDVNILGMAETNVNWRLPEVQNDFQKATKNAWRYFKASMATCKAKMTNKAQPGGVAQVTVGPFLSKIIEHGADTVYGRWCYHIYQGRKNRKLAILTAYCPTAKEVTGPRRVIQQQRSTMIQEGERSRDPTSHFYTKLKALLTGWKAKGYEILTMMDANYTWEEQYIQELVSQTGLVDIHREVLEHLPGTYERGNRRIDLMLGTRGVLECTQRCGYEEYDAVAKSDHRAVYADFDFRRILGNSPPDLTNPSHRHLTSHIPKHVHAYKVAVHRYFVKHRVYQRVEELRENPRNLPATRLQENYEALDRDITSAMLAAEKSLKCKSHLPWSPALKHAVDRVHYWAAIIRCSRNQKDATAFVRRTSEKLKRSWEYDLLMGEDYMKEKQQQAYTALREVRKRAKDLRESFLMEQATAYELAGIHEAAVALKQLKHWEQQRDTAALLKRRLKTQKVGQVNKIWIPKDPTVEPSNDVNEWVEEADPKRMESLIIQQNIKHFGQARDTPFTMEPLSNMQTLQHPIAQAITQGSDHPAVTQQPLKETKKLLETLAIVTNHKTMEIKLDLPTLKHIYRHWKEKTATSPSGRHLGHFHALLKPDGIDRSEEADVKIPDHAWTIWEVHWEMIYWVIKWGYVPQRWKQVLTLMLEKKKGSPYLHRLRPINMYESE